MKQEFEYLLFVRIETKGKTGKWNCCNKRSGDILGEVKWHGAWRQYCYFPLVQAVYSKGCLNDITEFIGQLKLETIKEI